MRKYLHLLSATILFACSNNAKLNEEDVPKLLPVKDMRIIEGLIYANSFYQKEDYESALEGYNLIIGVDSTVAEAYYKRGYCLLSLDRLSESTNDFLIAAELGYRKADAYYNAGLNQTMLFNDSVAIFYFKKSLKINPDQKDVINEIKVAERRIISQRHEKNRP